MIRFLFFLYSELFNGGKDHTTCFPIKDDRNRADRLPDGTPCYQGFCNMGQCERTMQVKEEGESETSIWGCVSLNETDLNYNMHSLFDFIGRGDSHLGLH